MKLTQNTAVSLSLIIPLVGAVVWLSTVWAQGKENASAIFDVKTQQEKDRGLIQETHDGVLILCTHLKLKCDGK